MTEPSTLTTPAGGHADPAGTAPPVTEHPFAPLLRAIEHDASIDGRAAAIDRLAEPLGRSALAPALRGRHLGHALHPLMTDLPLGCWTSAMLLDAVGGRAARPAARRLTGLGLLGVVPAALSGLVEFDALARRPDRRVATTHAVANSIAAGCQLLSWRARRRDRQLRGVWWGLVGNSIAAASGYLGGHLAFARGVGDGERGSVTPGGPTTSAPSAARGPSGADAAPLDDGGLLDDRSAASALGVTVDRLEQLVEQGLLHTATAATSAGVRRFRHSDVEAVRLVGG